jgi:hypothetical protein
MLYNTPSRNYSTVLTFLKMKLLIDGKLDLMEIKKAFRTTWAGLKQMSPNTTQQSETALIVKERARPSNFKRIFKGDCRTCGKKGHKSADCRENPNNSDKHPATWNSKTPEAAHKTVNNHHCGYCNKDGHSEERCFKKKRDEREKPEKITSENEQSLCVYETALI